MPEELNKKEQLLSTSDFRITLRDYNHLKND